MSSDLPVGEAQSPKRPPSPIVAGILGAIFIVACPVPPPHVPGIILGSLIGSAVAGARAKAGAREAAIIGLVMAIVVAVVALIFTGVIAIVITMVPPSSVENTPFANLDILVTIGIGLLAALAYGVIGFGVSYATGFVVRRQSKSSPA